MMTMNKLPNWLENPTIATWLACGYLLFSHLPGTAAMVNILLGLLVVSTVTLLWRHEISLNVKSGLVWSFLALLVAILMSVLISPYWEESLRPLRRDILPMVLVFVLLVGQRNNRQTADQTAQMVIWSIVAAFAIRTILALSDWLGQGIGNDAYTIDRPAARFFDFFAIDAAIMMPVAIAALLDLAMRTSVRILLGLVLLVAYVLVVISGIRAALLAVTLVTVIQLLPLIWKHKRQALLLVSAVVVAGSIFFAARIDKLTERYATIFYASTYQSQEQGYSSFYERRSIWKGALDMIKERPLLGYGLGWQKFYDVAHNEGFFERWQQSNELIDRAVVNYFKPLEKGQANPHNMWIQILFETGVVGLLAYISMLAVLLYRAVKSLRSVSQSDVSRCFGAGTLAYLLSYLMINMMNGLWLGAGATLALLIVSEILRDKED